MVSWGAREDTGLAAAIWQESGLLLRPPSSQAGCRDERLDENGLRSVRAEDCFCPGNWGARAMGEVEVQPVTRRRGVGGLSEGLVVVGLNWQQAPLRNLHLKERGISETACGGSGEVGEEMCPRPGFGSVRGCLYGPASASEAWTVET